MTAPNPAANPKHSLDRNLGQVKVMGVSAFDILCSENTNSRENEQHPMPFLMKQQSTRTKEFQKNSTWGCLIFGSEHSG